MKQYTAPVAEIIDISIEEELLYTGPRLLANGNSDDSGEPDANTSVITYTGAMGD